MGMGMEMEQDGDGGGGGIKIEEEENIRRLNLRITQCSKQAAWVILDDEDSNGLLSDLTEESANNHMDCNLIDYDKSKDKSNLDVWKTVNDEDLSLILQSNTEDYNAGITR